MEEQPNNELKKSRDELDHSSSISSSADNLLSESSDDAADNADVESSVSPSLPQSRQMATPSSSTNDIPSANNNVTEAFATMASTNSITDNNTTSTFSS